MAAQLHSGAPLGGPPPLQEDAPTVAIAGGGLAGLAAAARLLELGARPVVYEKRPFLGGRAFSFVDRETGVEVDNGQHVFLGVCSQYIAFLKLIDAWDRVHLASGLDIPVLSRGKLSRLKTWPLPGSLGMLPVLLRYAHLGWRDKARVAYGMLKIRGARREPGGGVLDNMTLDKWMRWHSQNDRTIANFWNLIVLPSLNDDISEVSADVGLMLFQTALLGEPSDAAIGYSRVGLTSLAGDSAQRWIEGRGGDVQAGVEVAAVEVDGAQITGLRTASGGVAAGDAYVLALPFYEVEALLPPELAAAAPFSLAASLEPAPIVGVHIWYDRQVLDEDFVAVLDSPIQWLFNASSLHAEAEKGQHVVVSLSGAWEWRDSPKSKLREVFVPEMARLFPRAAAAGITRFIVVKQLAATFRSKPGAARFRPSQLTPVPNLFLAGDWTQTGWPSTMESAVRSGNLAAEAVAAHLGLAAGRASAPPNGLANAPEEKKGQ